MQEKDYTVASNIQDRFIQVCIITTIMIAIPDNVLTIRIHKL